MGLNAVVRGLAGFVVLAGLAHAEDAARFHHVHLNVVSTEASVAFYEKYFSGVHVRYRDKADAVLTDRSFLLFNEVPAPAPSALQSAIYHIGWGGVDGLSEYRWRKEKGMSFQTDVTPLGDQYFFYAYGPDDEVVEVWTGFQHQRFGHVHLLAKDVNEMAQWFMEHLGLEGPDRDIPKPEEPPADFDPNSRDPRRLRYLWSSAVRAEGVTINIFEQPTGGPRFFWWTTPMIPELQPTKGRVIDHMAFSYEQIEPVYERMKKAGADIVEPIRKSEKFGFDSFFVMAPDGLLIEIVEAKPLPEAEWR